MLAALALRFKLFDRSTGFIAASADGEWWVGANRIVW